MEDATPMPQNGGQQAKVRIERNSTTVVDSPGTSTDHHSITIENSNATNGIHQGAAPNIPSTSNSQITPASNNSDGTSNGQSSSPNEDPQIHQGAAPNIPSTSNSQITQEITPDSNNSAGTSQGQSSNPNEDLETMHRSISFSLAITGAKGTLDDYRPLRQAASKGDWPAAKAFYDEHNDCGGACITTNHATALHIGVAYQKTTFIKKWLQLISPEDLRLRTNYGFTVLHTAAQVGNVSIAKQLVEKDNELPLITDDVGDTPLIVAAYAGHTNMASYLFSLSSTSLEQLTKEKCIELLHHTIRNDMYDIALQILNNYPSMAKAGDECWWEVLEMFANKSFSIGNERELSFWKLHLNSWFKGIYNKVLMKTSAHQLVKILLRNNGIPDIPILSKLILNDMALIFEAAKAGNVEFLIIISDSYPDLLWKLNENNMSIFHTAILHRQESVFNLIYEIGDGMNSLASNVTHDNKENMLHLAGKLAPSDRLNIVSGAALQMQRELLWFKEIQNIVPRSYAKSKNFEGKTPREIFVQEHKDLRKDGEKWMKNTANNCMIAATLIATVMFAAAFTVPGGNDQNKGTPILLRKTSFKVFFISDAISLCSSSTSIVIFLSILTSRYTENDFLKSIPSKLLLGLATLFISIVGMMVAFIATFFLVYTREWAWTAVVVIASASIPIISFGLLHSKIWVDTCHSTYKSGFLFQPHKHRLF